MLKAKNLAIWLVYLFSFTMAFGKINDTLLGGYWFDILTALTCLVSLYFLWPKVNHQYVMKFARPLLVLVLLMFVLGLFQGDIYFNVKFLAAIGVYVAMMSFVIRYPQKSLQSIFYFSLGVALMVLLYYLGVFEANVRFSKGRIYLFEENPNSISTRVSIAVVYLFYMVINNPLHFDKKRWLLLLLLPLMLSFIFLTGSKGSTILALIGIYGVFIYSSLKQITKTTLSILIGITILTLGITYFKGTTVYQRFIESDSTFDLGTREEIWINALDIFWNNPWGIGEKGYFEAIKGRIGMALDTHNLFIYILVTSGLIGFLLFSTFIFRLFRVIWQQFQIRQIISPVFFLIILLLMSKTGGVLTYLIMWYVLAFITGYRPSIKYYE